MSPFEESREFVTVEAVCVELRPNAWGRGRCLRFGFGLGLSFGFGLGLSFGFGLGLSFELGPGERRSRRGDASGASPPRPRILLEFLEFGRGLICYITDGHSWIWNPSHPRSGTAG